MDEAIGLLMMDGGIVFIDPQSPRQVVPFQNGSIIYLDCGVCTLSYAVRSKPRTVDTYLNNRIHQLSYPTLYSHPSQYEN